MITVVLFIIAAIAFYLYGTRTYSYWKLKRIKCDTPVPFFGNNMMIYLLRKSITQLSEELYWKYPKEKVVGLYRASRPVLLIRDPKIAKRVLTTDFKHFYPRGVTRHRMSAEPLLRNLVFSDGDLWRFLRQHLTPAFTSVKLKAMFPLIVERAERLQTRVHQTVVKGKEIDALDLMSRYTIDFIGACGFGLDADALQEENSAFRKFGTKVHKKSIKQSLFITLTDIFPIFRSVKILTHIEEDFFNLIDHVLKQRNNQISERNDFVDFLIECKQKGTITCESIERTNPDDTPEIISMEMDDRLLAAQVFIFFAAGFETSSTAMGITLNELAHHPDIQAKVQKEINTVLANHNNKLSYDAINDMTYLKWVFKESMRIFPSCGYLLRQCARKYTFEDLDLSIDEGVGVMIPVQALHNDPQYFDNPDQFRPERFDPKVMDMKSKYVYMPFGDGPRSCVGPRMAMMQSLAGLAAVLSIYSVCPVQGAPRRAAVDPAQNVVQAISGGLPLRFEALS